MHCKSGGDIAGLVAHNLLRQVVISFNYLVICMIEDVDVFSYLQKYGQVIIFF